MARTPAVKNLICGIDPGKSGAISFLDEKGKVVLATKMPDGEKAIAAFFRLHRASIDYAVIEKLQPFLLTSKVSMFKLGTNYGMLLRILAAYGIRYAAIRPVVWMTALSCRTGGDKNVTKTKAQARWKKTKVTHAIADSLLIAEFARKFRGKTFEV